ncbi:hypothetical protein EMWEY_00039210 [Eimeria maxima]|uniref:PCI domain-containing protein n=1 Tax=Eimeria maxima TaxID=5804 RepID=U6M017_EIMMA|nr:hypothetical protein EMWEY_00039210 [Eimeria maxima]CDJ57527.1 hypothetical protein EMWEY_00039210 [Eimeria maxima]
MRIQKDIAVKLGLDSAQEAEAVAAKAILDGVIDATIDHDQQFLQSKAVIFVELLGALLGTERQPTIEDDERKRAMQEERARAEDEDLGDDMDMI